MKKGISALEISPIFSSRTERVTCTAAVSYTHLDVYKRQVYTYKHTNGTLKQKWETFTDLADAKNRKKEVEYLSLIHI